MPWAIMSTKINSFFTTSRTPSQLAATAPTSNRRSDNHPRNYDPRCSMPGSDNPKHRHHDDPTRSDADSKSPETPKRRNRLSQHKVSHDFLIFNILLSASLVNYRGVLYRFEVIREKVILLARVPPLSPSGKFILGLPDWRRNMQ